MNFQPVRFKKENEIAKEWDDISQLRYMQISEKKDLSYEYILKPYFLEILKEYDSKRIVDLGCGTGNLTYELSKISEVTVGLDLSEESIGIARRCFGNKQEKITFINQSIEKFGSTYSGIPFTIAVANMTFMDVLNIEEAFSSIKNILSKNASLIFSITHPCFWPKYRGYENEEWFNYKKETIVEADFQISLDKNGPITTHLHRPLEKYIKCLFENGFVVEKIVEPVNSVKVAEMYPNKVDYPRFMIIHAKLN